MELNFPKSQIYFHIASMLTDVQNEVHVKLPNLTGNVQRCGLMRDSHFYFSTKASCHLRFLCLNNRSCTEESSVPMSLNMQEILTGNTKRKSVRATRQCEPMRWTESYFSLHSHATVGFLDHADIVSSIP